MDDFIRREGDVQRPSATVRLGEHVLSSAERTLQKQQCRQVGKAISGMPALVPSYVRRTAATRGAGFAASGAGFAASVASSGVAPPHRDPPQSSSPTPICGGKGSAVLFDGAALPSDPLTRHHASASLGKIFPSLGGSTSFAGTRGTVPRFEDLPPSPATGASRDEARYMAPGSAAQQMRREHRWRGLIGGGGWGGGSAAKRWLSEPALGSGLAESSGGWAQAGAAPTFLTGVEADRKGSFPTGAPRCRSPHRQQIPLKLASERSKEAQLAAVRPLLLGCVDAQSPGAQFYVSDRQQAAVSLRPLKPRLRGAAVTGSKRMQRHRAHVLTQGRRVFSGLRQLNASDMMAQL